MVSGLGESGLFVPSGDASKLATPIQLPPPNVTGTLHMGHAFQQTLMDTRSATTG